MEESPVDLDQLSDADMAYRKAVERAGKAQNPIISRVLEGIACVRGWQAGVGETPADVPIDRVTQVTQLQALHQQQQSTMY